MTQRTNQIGGDHYAKLAIDPFTFAMANRWDPMMHSILKYLTRYPHKGTPAQDLRKAAHIARYRCEFGIVETGDNISMYHYVFKNNIQDLPRQALLFRLGLAGSFMYSLMGGWKATLVDLAAACEAEACKYE